MRTLRHFTIASALVAALLLASCGTSTVSPPAPAPTPVPVDPAASADPSPPAVHIQDEEIKVPIQDGEVIDAPPGKASALACARTGCTRPGAGEHALEQGGKKLLFCSREHLEEFRKTSAKE